jgi:5'-deoxynucleotidase YfbR-like HD superfamily hydrolase
MPESCTITVRDRSPGGKSVHEIALAFDATEVRLRDIIAERVRMDIDLYERRAATSFANNLVQPTDAEARLDQAKSKRPVRRIDADKQIETALHAFERNGFFVLVGDRQVTDLDQTVSLAGNPEISFIKLTPLVGG